MIEPLILVDPPRLPVASGRWRPAYWEPVMATGERLCFAILVEWQGQCKAVRILGDDRLSALFSGFGPQAATLLDRAVRFMNASLEDAAIEAILPPMSGVFFGKCETAHANDMAGVLHVAKLMSSSLASLADPDASDIAESSQDVRQRAKQFRVRVRNLVLQRRPELLPCFDRSIKLPDSRRAVSFGFLSESLVAHFGLLQPTNLRRYVMTARGMFTELALAKQVKPCKATLVLGHPRLDSATLAVQEREALSDYLHDVSNEALRYGVSVEGAESDEEARDKLLAAI